MPEKGEPEAVHRVAFWLAQLSVTESPGLATALLAVNVTSGFGAGCDQASGENAVHDSNSQHKEKRPTAFKEILPKRGLVLPGPLREDDIATYSPCVTPARAQNAARSAAVGAAQ